jgi:hypothetical protein
MASSLVADLQLLTAAVVWVYAVHLAGTATRPRPRRVTETLPAGVDYVTWHTQQIDQLAARSTSQEPDPARELTGRNGAGGWFAHMRCIKMIDDRPIGACLVVTPRSNASSPSMKGHAPGRCRVADCSCRFAGVSLLLEGISPSAWLALSGPVGRGQVERPAGRTTWPRPAGRVCPWGRRGDHRRSSPEAAGGSGGRRAPPGPATRARDSLLLLVPANRSPTCRLQPGLGCRFLSVGRATV